MASKIIALIAVLSFLMTDINYAGAYQQCSLRVPMDKELTYKRMERAIGGQGVEQLPVTTTPEEIHVPASPPPVAAPVQIYKLEPVAIGKVRKILDKARTKRPEPAEVAAVSLEDIYKGAGIDSEQRIGRITQSKVFQRLESLFPYIEDIVIEMLRGLQQGRYAKVLCVSRDAEIIYDAAKTVLAGTQYENEVMLFPGSLDFIDFDLIRKLVSGSAQEIAEMREFFAQFGITEDFFKDNTRALLLDSGLEGTVGKELHYVIWQLFSLSISFVQEKVDFAMIGTDSGSYYGRRFMDFSNKGVNLNGRFPSLANIFQSGGKAIDFYIVAAMQTLPRYHGPYAELMRIDGRLCAIPAAQEPVDDDELDTIETVNASVVHPLAAMLVQRRVVEYFENKKAELLAKAGFAPSFTQSAAVPPAPDAPASAGRSHVSQYSATLELSYKSFNRDSTHGVSARRYLEVAQAFMDEGDMANAEAYARLTMETGIAIGHEAIPVDVVISAKWIIAQVELWRRTSSASQPGSPSDLLTDGSDVPLDATQGAGTAPVLSFTAPTATGTAIKAPRLVDSSL